MLPIALASGLSGCPAPIVYHAPVAKFQTAVISAADIIRPYLLNINNLIVTANLYDKVGTNDAWKLDDLNNGIPEKEIQVRLLALSIITNYANALAAVVDSKDVANLQTAAKTLGGNIDGLSTTVQSLDSARKSNPATSAVGAAAARLDLSGPVSSVVTLVGTVVIEHKQRQALEDAIINANAPIGAILDLLKQDLGALSLVGDSSYAAKKTGLVLLYNKIRAKAAPRDLPMLIDTFVQESNSINKLRALQTDSLLTDMKDTHTALVTFAKSDKTPKSFSDLAAQIDVFTAHVQLFEQAIASIQSTTKSSK